MQTPPLLTDRKALERHRARAMQMDSPAMFLQKQALNEVEERLTLVNKAFTDPAIVTGFPQVWENVFEKATLVADNETLDLVEGSHDLVIHAMSLHWANDPVGQMVQARRALRPDGLFIGLLFGGQTLSELRISLAQAEVAQTGGLSPRVAPMGEIRELGALLQRAGFALPVADSIQTNVTYKSALHLMRDLRAMGETNALANRNPKPLRKSIVLDAVAKYAELYAKDGRIPATFETIILTGWAPDASQQQPLRPGAATTRLSQALSTKENPL